MSKTVSAVDISQGNEEQLIDERRKLGYDLVTGKNKGLPRLLLNGGVFWCE